jgi:hypothetical protein
MDLIETGNKSAYWILLAQDRLLWRALVNTVMNFRIPYKTECFWVAERLLASQELLHGALYYCTMRSNKWNSTTINKAHFRLTPIGTAVGHIQPPSLIDNVRAYWTPKSAIPFSTSYTFRAIKPGATSAKQRRVPHLLITFIRLSSVSGRSLWRYGFIDVTSTQTSSSAMFVTSHVATLALPKCSWYIYQKTRCHTIQEAHFYVDNL